MFALSGFQGGLLIFRIIYLKDVLMFNEASISILPFVSSIAMLVVYIGIIPAVARQHKEYNFLYKGGLISVAGAFLFIAAGAGAVGLMFVSIIITALGDALASPFKQSCFNNMIGEEHRAKALSINYTLTALCAIPSGIIAGILYKSNPVYPFILSLIFLVINFALCFVVYSLEGRGKTYTNPKETTF